MSFGKIGRFRSRTYAVIAPACLFLISCASLEETMQSLASAPICCAAPGDFTYEPLSFVGWNFFEITLESAAFDFPTGKSYFRAFELPKQAAPYTITVKSYAGDHVPDQDSYRGPARFSVFVPALMLLDADHAVTRLVDEKTARPIDQTILPPTKLGMETAVTIGREHANEKFLAVFTPRRVLEGITEASLPHAVWFGNWAIPTGLREPVHLYHAPVGFLRITLSGSGRE